MQDRQRDTESIRGWKGRNGGVSAPRGSRGVWGRNSGGGMCTRPGGVARGGAGRTWPPRSRSPELGARQEVVAGAWGLIARVLGDKWQLLAPGAHASPWTEPAATPPRWQHSYGRQHADAVTVRWGGGSSLRAVSRQASAASSWSALAAAAQPGMGGSQAGALCNLMLACISPGF